MAGISGKPLWQLSHILLFCCILSVNILTFFVCCWFSLKTENGLDPGVIAIQGPLKNFIAKGSIHGTSSGESTLAHTNPFYGSPFLRRNWKLWLFIITAHRSQENVLFRITYAGQGGFESQWCSDINPISIPSLLYSINYIVHALVLLRSSKRCFPFFELLHFWTKTYLIITILISAKEFLYEKWRLLECDWRLLGIVGLCYFAPENLS